MAIKGLTEFMMEKLYGFHSPSIARNDSVFDYKNFWWYIAIRVYFYKSVNKDSTISNLALVYFLYVTVEACG